MRGIAPIYIWRKLAKREWLLEHEAALDTLSGGRLAVIELADRKQLHFEACASRTAAQRLLRIFGGKMEKLPRDWLKRFSRSNTAKPIRIGGRLFVTSAEERHSCRPGRGDSVAVPSLRIPASAAFGTGEHATTAMSLRMLERLTRSRLKGWRMLDAGTGSGILALAASRFGAKEVVGIDNDPTAIATAKENARSNRISGVRFLIGDVAEALRGHFDFITANLYSELLVDMLPKFRQSLVRDGRLILSGILRQQETELVRSLQVNRFCIEEIRRRGKWIALAARLSS
jgi:ribosomal protein L11 methyltransferase